MAGTKRTSRPGKWKTQSNHNNKGGEKSHSKEDEQQAEEQVSQPETSDKEAVESQGQTASEEQGSNLAPSSDVAAEENESNVEKMPSQLDPPPVDALVCDSTEHNDEEKGSDQVSDPVAKVVITQEHDADHDTKGSDAVVSDKSAGGSKDATEEQGSNPEPASDAALQEEESKVAERTSQGKPAHGDVTDGELLNKQFCEEKGSEEGSEPEQDPDEVPEDLKWRWSHPTTATEWQLACPTFSPHPNKHLHLEHIPRNRKINHVTLKNYKVQHERNRIKFVLTTIAHHKFKMDGAVLVPLRTLVKRGSDHEKVWKMSNMWWSYGNDTFTWRYFIRCSIPKIANAEGLFKDTVAFHLESFDKENEDPIKDSLKLKNSCTLQVIALGDGEPFIISSVTFHLMHQKGAVVDWLVTTPHGGHHATNTKEYLGKGLAQYLVHFVQPFALKAVNSQVVWLHCTKSAKQIYEGIGFADVSSQFNAS